MAKKLAQIVSTQAFSPVSDVKGGIVITRDGRYVKILEFSSINFSLLSASDQESVTDSYGAALKNFPNNTQIKAFRTGEGIRGKYLVNKESLLFYFSGNEEV